MVITSPFSSIKGYIISKPPLVLFTLCLIGFAITTFIFAYYVERNEDLPNLDAHRDLVSFLSYLSKNKLCISPNEIPISHHTSNAKNISDPENLTTIYVTAHLDSKILFHNITNIQGHLFVTDWVSECATSTDLIKKIQISFALPLITTNNSIDAINSDICVKITGPEDILAPAVKSNQCIVPTTSTQIVLGHFISKPHTERCQNSHQTAELTYELNSFNGEPLSTHDRSVINLHLFHTSYFLLVMAITLICYAMIKGKPMTNHQSMDKMPLNV